MTQPDPTAEVEARRTAQEKEYGAYVATEQIMIGNALAFDIGHAVPVSHVESGVVSKDAVAKSGTAAANRAQGLNPNAPAATDAGKAAK